MTRAASAECLLPLPATKEWGEGRGEGRPCKHCPKAISTGSRHPSPLSLALPPLRPLRRERVLAARCSPSYGLLLNIDRGSNRGRKSFCSVWVAGWRVRG